MNILSALCTAVVTFILTGGVPAEAFCTTGLNPTNFASPFSKDFTAAYLAATKIPFSTSSVYRLESMLAIYQQPEEQAELRLTFVKIYNQWGCFINHSKAVEQLGAALSFKLAPTVKAQALQWRGNSYEKLKQRDDAAGEYIQGLLLCLEYDLPTRAPTLPPVGRLSYAGSTNNPIYKHMFAEHQREWARRNQAEFDRAMVGFRSSFTRALQRVSGDKLRIRELAERIVKDERKIQSLLDLLNSPTDPP